MKFRFEKNNEEIIVAYAKYETEFIKMIRSLCFQDDSRLLGYLESKIKELNPTLIECFFTSDDKIYALSEGEQYHIKRRLYELYEDYKDNFVFINQGCLANIHQIKYFDANIGGSLLVVFKSGYKDYVSRRQLKIVKERLGIKK